ncbi:divergent polysaccharide deacetylase family protein [Sedimentitalea sp. XS_ASV28]|uniref:divergent polysaccharide deacetylase family protein n=1 Tax=Sedimentitalea sp. XS_ASV28 TaxID=3241296 RepID=UPI0035199ECF
MRITTGGAARAGRGGRRINQTEQDDMRGFLGGIVLGLVLCGVGLAALSVWSPLAPAPELMPVAVQPMTPAGAEPGRVALPADPVGRHEPPVSPAAHQPQTGDVTGIAAIESRVGNHPAAGTNADAPAAPQADAARVAVPELSDPVVSGNAPVVAPHLPESERDGEADTAAPAGVGAADRMDSAERLFAGGGDTGLPSAISVTHDSVVTGAAPAAVAPDTVSDLAPEAPVLSAPVPDIADEPDLVADTDVAAPTVPQVLARTAVAPAPPITAAPAPEAATQVADQPEPTLPRIAPLPQAGVESDVARPLIGTPVIPLTERAKPISSPQGETGQAADMPPLRKYAEPFANAGGAPVMSIILTDQRDVRQALDILRDLPFPVSIAVDPSMPDAAARMAQYRAAGHEVLARIELPDFATARDVEVSLAASFDILPETVAVLESENARSGSDVAVQLVAAVNGSGRGLVMRNIGLNASLRLAQGDGAPVAALFREIDSPGQESAAIERNLDQAVFRASQDGRVAVTGRLTPETVAILRDWVAGHRASRVALAPVSALFGAAANPS